MKHPLEGQGVFSARPTTLRETPELAGFSLTPGLVSVILKSLRGVVPVVLINTRTRVRMASGKYLLRQA